MTIRSAFLRVFLGNTIAVVIALAIYHLGGRDHFGERGFITFLSTFQLLTIAWLSHKIAQARPLMTAVSSQKSATLLWRVISWGFIFLAADEFLSIHEVTDLFIHDIFNLQETDLSDRLDDLIVGLYGVLGGWVLWSYRHELKPYRQALTFLKRAFVLMFVMVGLDMFGNEQDLLELFFTPERANTLQLQISHIEDSFKLFAEAYFVLAFYSILKQVHAEQKKLRSPKKASQLEVEHLRR